MNQDEKRKLETVTFLEAFKDRDNVQALWQLKLIRSHHMLASLLNECPKPKRYEMLEAIRYHLPFEALSLAQYEIMLKERAAAWQQRREQMGEDEREAIDKLVREHGLLMRFTFTCYKCQRTASFDGEQPKAVLLKARQRGWMRDKTVNKEVCPKCPCEDRGKRKKCPGCSRRHYAPSCRVLGQVEEGAPLIGGAKENIVRLN